MKTFRETVLCAVLAAALVSGALLAQTAKSPASQGLEKLKALQGEWIDVDGVFGTKGAVNINHTPEEMVTVYHLDKDAIVLTHYCSGGNQPRMRSKGLAGNLLVFDYDGGMNIDPAKTSHMHSTQMEFISADEIRATWNNWSNGKPDEHKAVFRIQRKK
jgi:hypothetical protein